MHLILGHGQATELHLSGIHSACTLCIHIMVHMKRQVEVHYNNHFEQCCSQRQKALHKCSHFQHPIMLRIIHVYLWLQLNCSVVKLDVMGQDLQQYTGEKVHKEYS